MAPKSLSRLPERQISLSKFKCSCNASHTRDQFWYLYFHEIVITFFLKVPIEGSDLISQVWEANIENDQRQQVTYADYEVFVQLFELFGDFLLETVDNFFIIHNQILV